MGLRICTENVDIFFVVSFIKDLMRGDLEGCLERIRSFFVSIPYEAGHRKVVKVGVNFDSATRTIGEWVIEEE